MFQIFRGTRVCAIDVHLGILGRAAELNLTLAVPIGEIESVAAVARSPERIPQRVPIRSRIEPGIAIIRIWIEVGPVVVRASDANRAEPQVPIVTGIVFRGGLGLRVAGVGIGSLGGISRLRWSIL